MRITSDRSDPAFDERLFRRVKSVHLDGQLLTGCVTADDQAGYVKELVVDPLDPSKAKHDGVDWVYRERRGRVVITLKDSSRDWDKARKASTTRVQVGRCPRTKDILVQVFSVVRPGAIKQGRMHFDQLPSGLDPKAQKAGITAGAVAEMLCEQFGDTVDPSDACRAAIEQCTAMLLAEEAPQGRSSFILDQTAG